MCDHVSVTKIVLPVSPFPSMKQPTEALSLPDVHSALTHRHGTDVKLNGRTYPKKALRNIKRTNLVIFAESKVQVMHCPILSGLDIPTFAIHQPKVLFSCKKLKLCSIFFFFFFFSPSGLLYSWAKQNGVFNVPV